MEIELKFQIAPERLRRVRQAVATRTAQQVRLAARYFDTPGSDLAAARMALRLRLEGDVWVQTLKAEDRLAMRRHEHNQPLPGVADPALDLARHAGSPADTLLRQALAAAPGAELAERYRTEIQRSLRLVRHQGAVIELALDEGWLIAGAQRLAVHELEFELKRGPVSALIDLAGRWAARHALVLDVRSKSERGHGLAAWAQAQPAALRRRQAGADAGQAVVSPPTPARPGPPLQGLAPAPAAAAMLAQALQQVLANASQMANGPSSAEHLHQLRVGLRRVRTVLALFGPDLPGWTPEAQASLQAGLADCFAQLGAQRDQDALAATVWPALLAAGAPWVPAADPDDGGASRAQRRLAAAPMQQLWLQLLALALAGDGLGVSADQANAPAARAPAAAPAKALGDAWARRPLRHLLRQVRADAQAFAALDDAARHRLRKRIKRLRYATDLCASLWPRPAVKRFLKALQQAQAVLGDLNDSVAAQARCQAAVADEPRAWFAVGWLTARCDAQRQACAPAMAALVGLRACWVRAGRKGKRRKKP